MTDAHFEMLAFFNLPSGMELVVVLVFGLLIFGRRLPDVARSVGKSIVEFKKGLNDAKHEIDKATSETKAALPDDSNHGEPVIGQVRNDASAVTPDPISTKPADGASSEQS